MIQTAFGVSLGESVIATEQAPIDEHLRERCQPTAGLNRMERLIGINRDNSVGNLEAAEKTESPRAPGATGQNSDFNAIDWPRNKCFRSRLKGGRNLRQWLVEQSDEQIGSFEHDCAWLKMTTPDLTGAIREAQMQMGTLRRKVTLEGNDLQIPLENVGGWLSRALKRRSGEIADNAQDVPRHLVRSGQCFERESQILAGSKLQRQRSHQNSLNRATGYRRAAPGQHHGGKIAFSHQDVTSTCRFCAPFCKSFKSDLTQISPHRQLRRWPKLPNQTGSM